MWKRVLPAAIAALSLLWAKPLPARTIFPPVGSLGGSAWDDHCPQNRFLVGLRGRVTPGPADPDHVVRRPGTIKSIRIVCTSLSTTGKRGVLWYGPERGGSGGDYQEFSCPRDAVVLAYFPTQYQTSVATVIAVCVSRLNGLKTKFQFGQNGAPASPVSSDFIALVRQKCPSGESGSVINGRSNGSGVLAIGLDCAIRLSS